MGKRLKFRAEILPFARHETLYAMLLKRRSWYATFSSSANFDTASWDYAYEMENRAMSEGQ